MDVYGILQELNCEWKKIGEIHNKEINSAYNLKKDYGRGKRLTKCILLKVSGKDSGRGSINNSWCTISSI